MKMCNSAGYTGEDKQLEPVCLCGKMDYAMLNFTLGVEVWSMAEKLR